MTLHLVVGLKDGEYQRILEEEIPPQVVCCSRCGADYRVADGHDCPQENRNSQIF